MKKKVQEPPPQFAIENKRPNRGTTLDWLFRWSSSYSLVEQNFWVLLSTPCQKSNQITFLQSWLVLCKLENEILKEAKKPEKW